MPKAILEFDLNDQDDSLAHARAIKSLDMSLALFEISINTKKSCLSVVNAMIENKENCSPQEAIEIVFERIHEILSDHSINIDNLII